MPRGGGDCDGEWIARRVDFPAVESVTHLGYLGGVRVINTCDAHTHPDDPNDHGTEYEDA
jgi:hypothetical protein